MPDSGDGMDSQVWARKWFVSYWKNYFSRVTPALGVEASLSGSFAVIIELVLVDSNSSDNLNRYL